MKRTIVAPFALPPAALTELKDWLGITVSADDAALAALLRSACEACESFTGQMPLEQDCEELLPARCGWIELATRPVQAITAVLGVPAEGARFALPIEDYAYGLSSDGSGRVTVRHPGAAGRIAVRFTAGLMPEWAALPDGLRHGLIRLAALLYRSREGDPAAPLPPATVAALWRPWRQVRL